MGTQSRIAAIDPGEDSGWASGVNGVLTGAGLVHPEWFIYLPNLVDYRPGDTLVIEHPKIYPRDGQVDPNKMAVLAGKVGEIKGIFRVYGHKREQTVLPFPREWKGQVEKTVHNRRTLKALTPPELVLAMAILATIPAGQQNNTIDAIGLFIWQALRDGSRRP